MLIAGVLEWVVGDGVVVQELTVSPAHPSQRGRLGANYCYLEGT